MLEALIHNRVDFVRLLLENGVSMHDFLTIGRLEELYNTDQGPPNTLYYIVRDVVKIRTGYHYKLIHIGMAIEKLMANGFRSHYTSSDFRHKYSSYRTKCREASRRNKESAQQRSGSEFFSSSGGIHGPAAQSLLATLQPPSMANSQSHPLEKEHVLPAISGSRALSNHILWRSAYRRDNFITPSMLSGCNMPQGKELAIELEDDSFCGSGSEHGKDFKYPFSDLLVWAVLTKRHEMALCMWQHGEEAMAKALVACRLYKSLAKEAAEDYLEVEICDELKKYAEEFRQLSLELLDHCYKQDDAQTLQLLTYELFYWGHETCLSLAVIVNNKQFWHILVVRFCWQICGMAGCAFGLIQTSREELMLQPQTAAEHEEAINNDSSSSSSESSSSSDSETDELSSLDGHGNNAGVKGTTTAAGTDNLNRLHVDHLTATNQLDRRRTSTGSVQSLNLASLFQSKRRRHRNRATTQFPAMDNTRELPSGIEMRSKVSFRSSIQSLANYIRAEPVFCQLFSECLALLEPHEHHDMSRKRTRSRPSSSVLGGVGAIALSATSALGAVSSPIAASSGHTSPGLTTPTPKATAMHLEAPGSNGSPAGLHGSSKRRIPSLFQWRRQTRSFKQGDEEAPRFHVPSFVVGGEDETSSRDSSCKNSPRNVADNYPLTTSSLAQHTNRRHSSSAHKNKVNEGEVNKAAESTGFPKGIPLPNVLPFNRKRQIKFRRKVYEFFVAPITTFWAWSISFVIFLSTLTYVLLIRTPPVPTYLEWYLLAYVVTFGLESIRKFFMSEPKKFSEKMEYFFGNYWNFITSVAIIGFVIGFCFRVNPSTSSNYGRIILAVDSVLWSIKLLDFLSVHPRFGPYITMAGKMVMNMSSIIVMLLISLLAFGLARQSITFPDEDWHWLLLRNVFYKPYFMLYGEVYADEIDTCGDEAWDEHLDKGIKISQTGNETNTGSCVPGHWIPPLMMTVFLLIANILLISMLIAIFNNIYDSSSKISQQIWLFQRYRQVIEYEGTPFLPPPLTTIYHIYIYLFPADSKHHSHGLKTIKYKEKKLALFDFTLKLFLSEDQVEKLHDFEEESMEDMAREKEYEKNRSSEERLHRTAERTDLILVRLNDLSSKENMLKGNVRELETRLEVMESRQSEILDCMRQINTTFSNLPMLLQCLQNASQSVPNQGVYQPHISETSHPTSFPQMSYITPEEEGESEDHVLVTSESLPEKQSEKTIPPTASGPAPPSRQISVAESMMAGRTRGSTLAFNDTTRLRAVSHATIMGSNTSSINAMSYTNTDGFGSALLEQPFAAAQRRHRTSTIAGGDIPTASVPMSVLNQSQRFESLASLEAKGPSAPQVIVHPLSRRGNSIRRRRRHDEYTSITDAINIEDILAAEAAAALEQSDESDHEDSQRSSRRRAGTSQPSIINKLEEGLQTEDDEADEDDEAEDEEDFDADDYEVEELRISGLGKLGDSIGIGIDMGDGEEDLEGELELKICTNSRINRLNEDEEDQQISSQNSTVHRVDTPNTTLRRARSSFIIHQNSVLKSFEEDVGGLSSSLYRDPQADNKQYASLDNSDMAFNNAYLKKTKSVEKQNSVTRESPKNEFINFSTPSTHYKMGGSLEGEDSRQSMKDTQEEHAHSAEQLKAKQNDF
uniref:Ion transport domain-containing protein n=1 Tax=Ditylenchus dipsaci TaxID=166011 RepID=A0A915DAN2_9BILA